MFLHLNLFSKYELYIARTLPYTSEKRYVVILLMLYFQVSCYMTVTELMLYFEVSTRNIYLNKTTQHHTVVVRNLPCSGAPVSNFHN